ncbi:MAG: hypothetical protein BMS9Abin36_1497 [Gammaproteobacteria bacterium]|nr:MAG: hypothetical protein BMS9Abin36_1497 [Gammaproteobacteria bacterium]
MATSHYSFWLMPSVADRRYWQQVIHDLAAEFEAPVFTPHVTLQVGDNIDSGNIEQLLMTVTNKTRALCLQIDAVSYDTQFTKTLFLQLVESPEASQLSHALAREGLGTEDYLLNPHISLLYKNNLSDAVKQGAGEKIQVPGWTVFFDELWAVECPGKCLTHADVESLKPVAKVKLERPPLP